MLVSSTLTTSAPRAASRSEQKPPGSSRVRSRTRTSDSGSSVMGELRSRLHPPRHPEKLAGLGDGRRAATDVLCHLTDLGDEVPVRARHVAVRQVEVVLESRAGV